MGVWSHLCIRDRVHNSCMWEMSGNVSCVTERVLLSFTLLQQTETNLKLSDQFNKATITTTCLPKSTHVQQGLK